MHQNPVRAGNLAVAAEYADGIEIQILPAIRNKRGGIQVTQSGRPAWSDIIHPANFAEQLIAVNTAKSGRMAATIKLAKAIADSHIKRTTRKISGYHLECLSIQAFRNYDGDLDPKSMQSHLFAHSIKAIHSPIPDTTGQSRFVDAHIEAPGPHSRRRASTFFGRNPPKGYVGGGQIRDEGSGNGLART